MKPGESNPVNPVEKAQGHSAAHSSLFAYRQAPMGWLWKQITLKLRGVGDSGSLGVDNPQPGTVS